jgi:hypothetical protein
MLDPMMMVCGAAAAVQAQTIAAAKAAAAMSRTGQAMN